MIEIRVMQLHPDAQSLHSKRRLKAGSHEGRECAGAHQSAQATGGDLANVNVSGLMLWISRGAKNPTWCRQPGPLEC
jgi:hypothetical protein